jgi:hypothetical protein
MPLQNRVTPFGEIIATPERGAFMGNRGCLHNERRELVRQFAVKRWIICLLEYKGIRLEIMKPGRYTQLFFLDEATALAAGHRPCALCRREAYREFTTLWQANIGSFHSIDEVDTLLHRERVLPLETRRARLDTLPDGCFIALERKPYLIQGDCLAEWTAGGYIKRVARPTDREVSLLTPPSLLQIIAAGYVPQIHQSVTALF